MFSKVNPMRLRATLDERQAPPDLGLAQNPENEGLFQVAARACPYVSTRIFASATTAGQGHERRNRRS